MMYIDGRENDLSGYGDEIASRVFETGASNYRYQFVGYENFRTLIKEALARPRLIFSGDAMTALVDSQGVAGLLSAFSGSEYESRKKEMAAFFADLRSADRFDGEFFDTVAVRARQCSYLNPPVSPRFYYLFAISVADRCRSTGLGQKLMSIVMDKAIETNHRGIHLDVLADNPAVKYYEKLGFAVAAEITVPAALEQGVPPHLRMIKVF